MIVLPKRTGFSQRHSVRQLATPYLHPLEEVTNLHRSAVTLSAIVDDVKAFGNPRGREIFEQNTMLRYAVHLATRAFHIPEQKMLHLNDLRTYPLKIWSASPGLPWRELGYRTKRDVAHDVDAYNRIRWFAHRVKNGDSLNAPDCCAFVRSHLCEPFEEKVRAVWGYPMTVTMCEAVFALPLIEGYQFYGSPIAYGYETACGGAYRVYTDTSRLKYKATLDFKAFDKTVPAGLIDVAFDILADNIDFVHYRDHGVADARRTWNLYNFVKSYFKYTPIRICDGRRFKKRGGVASGSYFTQLCDSVVNWILVTWAYLEQHGAPPEYLKVLGDDSISAGMNKLDLDAANELFRTIGMELNLKKTYSSSSIEHLTFLGYQINNGTPTKPYDRWIAALVYPERSDTCWDDVATRALGLLYACSGTDDAFDSLCRAIIHFKPFDINPGRSLAKMLFILGVGRLDPDPPDRFGFWRRLRIL